MKSPETQFLLDFFAALKVRGVCYAVMRNSETLPESLGGSDLDLLVNGREAADAVIAVAVASAKSNGGAMTTLYRTDAVVACFAGKGYDGWWGCHIDIFVGLKYYGLPYVDADKLIAGRVLEREAFYRLCDETDVVSFVKEMLYTGKTRKDYYPRAKASYSVHPQTVQSLFEDCLGRRGWLTLEGLFSDVCDDKVITSASRSIAKSIFRNGLRFAPVRTLVAKASNLCVRLRRILVRPGYCIAFLGTDGSGKSTLIESVKPALEQSLHAKIHYEHLRPNLLPSLARLAGKPERKGPTTDPHGGKVAGRLASLVRFFYYYVDYAVGYWVKIYPMLVKRPSMVFFDRYYYEYMIDPRRCAVRLPHGWAKFWSWFIPKPDLILCLGGEPEKIYARKPETSLEEVKRQVAALKKFCDGNRRAVWIDTTTSVEESMDAALTKITQRMSRRYK